MTKKPSIPRYENRRTLKFKLLWVMTKYLTWLIYLISQILAISFLVISGIGSLYYFYYAINSQEFERQNSVLNIVTLTVLFSIVTHGFMGALIMKRLKIGSSRQS